MATPLLFIGLLLFSNIFVIIRVLGVSNTYNSAGYADWPAMAMMPGLLTALGIRYGLGNNKPNRFLAVIAGLLALVWALISDYFVLRLVNSLALQEAGLAGLPLLLSPPEIFEMLRDYAQNDFSALIFWGVTVAMAVYMNLAKTLSRK